MLDPQAVKRFYDRFGARQDSQAFYEDAALDSIFAHSDFAGSTSIAEFGCGTGRFAVRILAAAPTASYVGFDVSTTMLDLTRRRLAPFGPRARVEQLEPGTVTLPLASRSVDRVLCVYVLDILSAEQVAGFLEDAERVLVPTGRLCLGCLTVGRGALTALVSGLWTLAYRLRPSAVGGCRPIRIAPACQARAWRISHHETVSRWGLTSEVLVATPPRR